MVCASATIGNADLLAKTMHAAVPKNSRERTEALASECMEDDCTRRAFCGTLLGMEFDPHTLHQIIQRIKQQMRCPQCGEKVPVDFACVRLTGDDFMLMQLKCEICDAYIVLHASLAGIKGAVVDKEEKEKILNASSSLCAQDDEVDVLRSTLAKSSGSFEHIFGVEQAEK